MDLSPLSPDDQKFLRQLATHLRKRVPVDGKGGSRDGVMFFKGDCDAIAERLERIAEFGDSSAEITRMAY